jgi:quercetin dioxygenase-like cupin family protein
MTGKPFVVADKDITSDGWNEPDGRGVVSWETLIDADLTPSNGLTCGFAVVEAGGFLALHRHAPAEFYHILEGQSVVTIDGTDHLVIKGDTVFIPPMAKHGIRNASNARLRFLFVFPTNTFAEVEYLFS